MSTTNTPQRTTTMRAITQHTYGGPEVLHLDEHEPVPAIAADEVLVRVHAAGVDRGTLHLLTGRPLLLRLMGFGVRRPNLHVPGLDVAGVVEAVGAEVTRFAVGDEVFGIAKGSFAELAAAKEEKLAPKPPSLSWEQAAVVPISGMTAFQGLRAGGIETGQRVLVLGASGGVGSFAVQIAKALGAEVTAVCSAAKVDLVASLGADEVLAYEQHDVTDGTRQWDLVFDGGGNRGLRSLRRALTRAGSLVLVGAETGGALTGGFERSLRALVLSPFVSQHLTMLVSDEHHADLLPLTELVESGQVVPALDRTFELAEAPAALERLASGAVRGKLAITVLP
jgi:NADPH:quinone reductase-like Zn-dependent oxidoreductase